MSLVVKDRAVAGKPDNKISGIRDLALRALRRGKSFIGALFHGNSKKSQKAAASSTNVPAATRNAYLDADVIGFEEFSPSKQWIGSVRTQILLLRIKRLIRGRESSRYIVVHNLFGGNDQPLSSRQIAKLKRFSLTRDRNCDTALRDSLYIQQVSATGEIAGHTLRLKLVGNEATTLPVDVVLPCYNLFPERAKPAQSPKESFVKRTSLRKSMKKTSPHEEEKCNGLLATPDQKTSWGHQQVIIKIDEPVNSLRGNVVAGSGDEPLAGVLVEIYDNPESLLMTAEDREAARTYQHRLAARVTGADGEFCFPEIPPGKYELRCSKPIEWDPTSAYVIVVPGKRRSENSKLVVSLQLSQ